MLNFCKDSTFNFIRDLPAVHYAVATIPRCHPVSGIIENVPPKVLPRGDLLPDAMHILSGSHQTIPL